MVRQFSIISVESVKSVDQGGVLTQYILNLQTMISNGLHLPEEEVRRFEARFGRIVELWYIFSSTWFVTPLDPTVSGLIL